MSLFDQLTVLRNHYGVDMGTGSLLLQIESREEIFANKMVAFALRPNRIKSRDLWDIAWLTQQGIQLPTELVLRKMTDHKQEQTEFLKKLQSRKEELTLNSNLESAFQQEISRFLPPEIIKSSIQVKGFWMYLTQIVSDACDRIIKSTQAENESIYKL